MKLIRYIRTIRHMKMIQVVWRLVLKFNRLKLFLFPQKILYKSFHIPKLILINNNHNSINCKLFDMTIKLDEIDWKKNRDKLINYHLHYFDFLNNCNNQIGEQAIKKWIVNNSPSVNNDGWEPYPLSLRIVNWIFFFSRHGRKPDKEIIKSLYLQGQWLFKQRELHLQANHLLKNIVSLLFWGYCFDNKKIIKWSLKNLYRQLQEQFTKSGLHYEFSSTYHAISVIDILDSYNLIQSENVKIDKKLIIEIENVLKNGVKWVEKLSDEYGYLPIGDVNYEGCPNADQIKLYAQKLGVIKNEMMDIEFPTFPFLKNGHFKIMLVNSSFSPNYNSAHSHQDKLSILLWYKDKPIFTDTGNYSYKFSSERLYSRDVEAHNTIQIDQFHQAELWDVFRVGYRGEIEKGKIGNKEIYSTFIHKKYRHQRRIKNVGRKIIIVDIIIAQGHHSFKQFFHIHPDNSIKKTTKGLIVNDVVNIKFQNDYQLKKTEFYPKMYKKDVQNTVIISGKFKNKMEIVTEIYDIL